MIEIGGVYTTFCQEERIVLQSIAIEVGGVSRYFSIVSGSGVNVTLLTNTASRSGCTTSAETLSLPSVSLKILSKQNRECTM